MSKQKKKGLGVDFVSDDHREYLDRMKNVRNVNVESFGSKTINISDYILSPEGWENMMFLFYFLSFPYLVGALFLFLFIAHASVTNFFTLDFTAFFIVWAIGYEVIAVLLLFSIFLSYVKYLKTAIKR